MVKKALAGLKGVKVIEDEWDRELDADEPMDLFFVEYDPSQVTVEKMREMIEEHGFNAVTK